MSDRFFSFTYQGDSPNRLDKYLVSRLPEFSRSRLQKLIKKGKVLVDGEIVLKTGTTLEKGMGVEISIPAPENTDLIPESIPLNIIFENDDLLLVDKPAGMVVHPSAGHGAGTLVHAALAHAPELEGVGGIRRPGVVHRLDKDTSGLIVLAKNDRAHQWLQDQFRDRQVKKVYLALVDGEPPSPQGRIEAAIGRDSSQRKRMMVTTPGKGREAISEYRTIEKFDQHTLLEVHIFTGRTHQIRVHLAFINCPIAGDSVYGRSHPSIPIKRHFLHAFRLSIIIPGEATPRQFESRLPDELEQILTQLRRTA
ncbi:MAG: RluA family pseudouridine synthase [Anaerolineales bacterium]|nr:RluA family pseudouridine synthase [Anaerolineales bacterium]